MPEALSEERLLRNLRAIGARNPGLAERLTFDVASDQVEILASPSGLPFLQLVEPGRLPLPALPPETEMEAAIASRLGEGDQPVLIMGIGFGYHLEALLKRSHPCRRIIAYERDPYLLRLSLLRADFSRDVLSGRLSFILGTDLSSVPEEFGKETLVVFHPLFAELYTTERAYLADAARRQNSETRRALVATGGLFVEDVIDTLRSMGIETLVWSPSRVSLEETRGQIQRFEPHFVFSINLVRRLPELCEELGIPCVVWEIDPGIERPDSVGKPLDRTFIFTYRRANIPRFRRAGFRNVEYLPLAANPGRRFPIDERETALDDYRCDISFVGSSMRKQAGALRDLFDLLVAGRDPEFVSSRRASWASPEWWRRMRLDASPPPPEFALSKYRHASDGEGRTIDLLYCLAETAASERRRQVVESLAPLDCHLWGDEDWREALPSSNYRGEAGHYRQLTLIYNASRVNLDINRIYQRDIVAMRVFDVLACGAFVLADFTEDLADLFDVGTEVAAYRSDAEVPRLVTHYLKNPSERIAIARAGHEKVLRDHTVAHRIGAILSRVIP